MSLHKRVQKLEAQVNFLLENFEERLALAIDKVVGEGLEIEAKSVDDQLKDEFSGDSKY